MAELKENEIKAIILDYEQTRDEIVAAIYMLENVQHAVLLEKRYLEYDKDSFREKRFEEIAVEMKYSYDRIVHMHGEALKEMQKLINSNKKAS
jgi:nitrogenase subunit NifH